MASQRITGGGAFAEENDPQKPARRPKDPDGRFEHPFAVCLASSDSDTSFMDVFPTRAQVSNPGTLHLPDFDIAVGINWAVNGAECPVVVFGWAEEQRLAVPVTVRESPPPINPEYRLTSQWFRIDMTREERTSVHSHVTEVKPWASLVRDTIVRVELEHWSETRGLRAVRRVLAEKYDSETEADLDEVTDQVLTPLLRLHDGRVVAALAETEEGYPLLLLPEWTQNKRAWLLAAWKAWVADGSMESPPPKSGYEDAAWMTAAELGLHEQIVTKQAEFRTVQEQVEADLADLAAQLGEVSASADLGFRRLLTKQADPLVAAVQEALDLFGFVVQDMDEVFDEKREDLRANTPDDQWTAIVEVKGYSKGGKASDFTKFVRYTTSFTLDERRVPDACWYVINAYCDQEPAARPGPFESAADAVKSFAKDANGLVIPTTELFKLVRDVQLGARTPEEARALLLSAQHEFEHTPTSSDEQAPDVRG